MQKIIELLPVLLIAIAMNLASGMYYNIGTVKSNFDFKVLINGLVKALIISGMFIGTTYCFTIVDLSAIGVDPIIIIMAAITLYVGKAMVSLGKILGLEINTGRK